MELKNELLGISSELVAQNQSYFVHMQKDQVRDRAPMLLVTVVGCHFLQVFGAAWNGGMVCHISDNTVLVYFNLQC